jgi:hypothetical protein
MGLFLRKLANEMPTYYIYILTNQSRMLYVNMAVAREKQLKGWLRAKKIALIEKMNPHWENLSLNWGIANGPGNFMAHLSSRPDPSTPDASHPPLRINT